MSRNRILGTPQNTALLPSAAGSVYNETYQDDLLVVPSTAAAGAPYCTVNLNGAFNPGGQPADGDWIAFADAFGALSAATPLVIVGKSGANGFPLLDGGAPQNSVTLDSAGDRREYMFSGMLGAWVRRGDSKGSTAGQGTIIVSNLAAVTAVDASAVPLGTWAMPETIGQPYVLMTQGALVVDGINVLASSTAGVVWVRIQIPVPRWTAQSAWFVNHAAGNDENDGTTNTVTVGSTVGPLATLAEWCRRLRLMKAPPPGGNTTGPAYTITTDAVPSTDEFKPSGLIDDNSQTSNVFEVIVQGTPTNTLTSVVGAGGYVVTNPGANTQATVDIGTPAAPFIGEMITITSGLGTGATAWILASAGGNLATVTDFYFTAPNVAPTLVPGADIVAGTGFTISTPTSWQSTVLGFGSPIARYRLVNLDFNGTAAIQPRGVSLNLNACKVEIVNEGPSVGGVITAIGCLYQYGALTAIPVDGNAAFVGTGFINAALQARNVNDPQGAVFQDCVLNPGTLTFQQTASFPNWGAPGNVGGANGPAVRVLGTNGLGFFGWTGNGVNLVDGGSMHLAGAGTVLLYGSSAVGGSVGVNIASGSRMYVKSTVTPSIAGAANQLVIDANAVIPSIAAGTGLPVAGAAINTWATYTGAPYSRNAMNLTNGTALIQT